MKILIADKFQSSGIQTLESLGCEVQYLPETTADTMAETLAAHPSDVLIVRSTRVSAEAIEGAGPLSLIVRAGAGYDSIDVATASRRGVFVANCPGKNSAAVAELAWGLILACDRRIPDQTADLRKGVWAKKEYAKAAGLKGRTLGIVGTGKIGMEIAQRGKAFGMNVIGWSRSLTPEKAASLGIGFCESLTELAQQSDVVSVSVAANAQTAHLIDEDFFNAMKPGATLVNTSRGSVVNRDALTAAINTKQIRAGLDVFTDEPGAGSREFSDPIVQQAGVYGTHHVGASTDQAQEAIASEAVRVVAEYQDSGVVPNCVNLAQRTDAVVAMTVRHLNQPGVLAHVFDTIGNAQINVEEMENRIYEGGEAACATIQLSGPLDASHLEAIKNHPSILSVESVSIS